MVLRRLPPSPRKSSLNLEQRALRFFNPLFYNGASFRAVFLCTRKPPKKAKKKTTLNGVRARGGRAAIRRARHSVLYALAARLARQGAVARKHPRSWHVIFHIWRRVARFGFDKTQSSAAHQWTFYLFNGATYERGQWDQIAIRAEKHIHSVIKQLLDAPSLKTRAESAFGRCYSSDYISRALVKTQMSLKDVAQLRECGLVSPDEFEHELDMDNYIGFKNGVYDVLNDRFMPKGRVPLNVVVSMCTNYDYTPPDDPRFPEMRAQIEEFYRKLHAEDYENCNDERLAAMWLLSGSLLFRGNVCKKAYVFLGSEGDNGKSTFTELIQLTLATTL